MAVIIQQLMGHRHGRHFYPAISGVAQSYNYYPFAQMTPEDGVAAIALGLGKSVMGGESSLRFSPRHPGLLPDRSTVEDQLRNAQRFFYALTLDSGTCQLGVDDAVTLDKREITDAVSEPPVRHLSSAYYPEEGRIRDAFSEAGIPVVTFHTVLKHRQMPLADLLTDLLDMGEEGMGSPVEMEFCVNLAPAPDAAAEFVLLQLRPMGAREELMRVEIGAAEAETAFVSARHALGNTIDGTMQDIVYVKPADFDTASTRAIAEEIGQINGRLCKQGGRYLLIGPGRWGSADRWLGIPVRWEDISGVGVIVETDHPQLRAEPSQGSHFFHNITTMGINYLTVSEAVGGRLDWAWLLGQPPAFEGRYIVWARLAQPFLLKVDGRHSRAVILTPMLHTKDGKRLEEGYMGSKC
jgi:hypothetical protein